MKQSTLFRAVLSLALVALVAAGSAHAMKVQVKPGEKMPDFTLTDYEGNEHTLSDYQGKVVVIDFSSHKCPYSKAVDTDVQKLHEKFKDQGVVVLSIDSHNDTPPEEIKAYAEEHGYTYTFLKDPENKYADRIGATRTPEMFVLDKEGTIVYYGAFDDRTSPEGEPTTSYTMDAVAAAVAGETPEVQSETPWGCTIKRVAKSE